MSENSKDPAIPDNKLRTQELKIRDAHNPRISVFTRQDRRKQAKLEMAGLSGGDAMED